MIYAFIVSFGDVPIAFFLTADSTSTLPARMFVDMQVDFRPSMLALSSIIVVLSVAVVLILNRMGALSFTDSSRR
jgi:putative spermidine/putrescine transport system permease protein